MVHRCQLLRTTATTDTRTAYLQLFSQLAAFLELCCFGCWTAIVLLLSTMELLEFLFFDSSRR
jgi:hypothetical protein